MHPATGWEVAANDHPAMNLTHSREVITVSPGAQTISEQVQRPVYVKYAGNAAAVTRFAAQGY